MKSRNNEQKPVCRHSFRSREAFEEMRERSGSHHCSFARSKGLECGAGIVR